MSDARVMIAVPTSEYARRADFSDYLNGMNKPDNTMMTFAHGASPAKNRNLMIQTALEQKATHILFVDDDMAMAPDALTNLLAHDKDAVSGLYLHRNYPHFPVMFEKYYPDGRNQYKFLENGINGLQRVVNCGFGFVLIKTDVFRSMEEPWVRIGQLDKDNWGDDIDFFNRFREAGFELYIDLDVKVGHIMSAIIIPYMNPNGDWATLYNTGSVENFQVPQLVPTKEEVKAQLGNEGRN